MVQMGLPYGWLLCYSAFFYNFLFDYWSIILFILRIQIGIDLYTNLDKALYW